MPSGQDPRNAAGEAQGDAPRGRKSFLLRLPPELLEELRTWSEAELRSLNGQIEYLLRSAVRRRKGDEESDR